MVPAGPEPAFAVMSPGRSATNVNVTTSVGLRSADAIALAYGVPPMADSTSGSANASSPPSTRILPVSVVVMSAEVTLWPSVTSWSGPPLPLIDWSSAVASCTVVNGWVRVTCRPPPSVGLGPSTVHPAAAASSRRRSAASPGAAFTTAASATTASVMTPDPSG